MSLFLSFWIHLQPALGKDFFKWESCYTHPISYNEKMWDWKYSPITALPYKYRLLWLKEAQIQTKQLCHTTQNIKEDFSLNFTKQDFKAEYKFFGKYPLVKDTEFYFPKGKYELSLNEFSEQVSLVIRRRSELIEAKVQNGKYSFTIEKSGIYNINLFTEEPIEYVLRSILIQKITNSLLQ